MGLVATSYGGTPIKAWSSPDVVQKCSSSHPHSNLRKALSSELRGPSVRFSLV
jgi:hypothetical protein